MAKGALEDIARLKRLQVERREAKSVSIPKPQKLAEAKQAAESVSQNPITNRITNTKPLSPSERSLKWRTDNPERYKETQRNLMRKKRGTQKDTGSE